MRTLGKSLGSIPKVVTLEQAAPANSKQRLLRNIVQLTTSRVVAWSGGCGQRLIGPYPRLVLTDFTFRLPAEVGECGMTAVASISTTAPGSSSADTTTTDMAGKWRPMTSR